VPITHTCSILPECFGSIPLPNSKYICATSISKFTRKKLPNIEYKDLAFAPSSYYPRLLMDPADFSSGEVSYNS